MRIVITLDIEGVEKDKIAVLVGEKPESPMLAAIPVVEKLLKDEAFVESVINLPAPTVAPVEDNATTITHHEDGTATVVHEPAPAPKKRGRKRKTVDIATPAQQETRECQEAAARELAGVSEAVKAGISEVAIKTDIGQAGTGSAPAPVAAPEPVPQADIPAVQVPLCPVCKEPMNADERYDAFLCIKDGQFNNTVKPSQLVKFVAIATRGTAAPSVPLIPEVKPVVTQAILTEDEQKTIKARLGKYWVSILPEAGMTADDGKSINAKLTQFANNFADGREWPNSRAWNAKQWDIFLGFMDGMVGSKGAKALVAHINQEIGSK